MAVTYIAHWLYFEGADLNFNVNASVVWDTTLVPRTVTNPNTGVTTTTMVPRGWVPAFNASAQVSGKIKLLGREKRQRLWGEVYLPRESFMANAMGDRGLGTCANTGAAVCEKPWTVRTIGSKFQYFIRVNIVY